MAGFSGNTYFWAHARQTEKGTAAAAPQFTQGFTGGQINITKSGERLEETDGSRDQSLGYVSETGVEGSPSCYARPDSIVSFMRGVLGTYAHAAEMDEEDPPAPTGRTIHTVTPSNSVVEYYTIWQVGPGGELAIRGTDCVLDSVKISGGAGEPLEIELSWLGLKGERITSSIPSKPTPTMPFLWALADVTLDGSPYKGCDSFELEIANNHEAQRGNGSTGPYDYFPGERSVTGSFDIPFMSKSEYCRWLTGDPAGTAVLDRMYSSELEITLTGPAGEQATFSFENVEWDNVEHSPDAGGGPVVYSLEFTAVPDGADPVMSFVAINSKPNTSY